MSLEDLTGTKYVNSLVATNPDGAADPKSQGDDHIRGIKNVILKTFPNVSGAITLTHTNINDAYYSGGTDVAVADGGTGASTAADARTNLGLGTMAVEDTVASTNLDDYPWGWEDFQGVAAGNYIFDGQTSRYTGQYASYTKVCEIKVPFAGTITTRLYIIGNDSSNKWMAGRIYVNGVATGTARTDQTATGGYYNENITVAQGDLVQLYVYMQDNITTTGYPKLAVMTDGAMVGGKLYTLDSDWV